MIVLPLNEEARSGRRIPWVTLALVVACVVVFVHNRAGDREVDASADAAIEEAWDYFVAHPYVRVSPDVAAILGEDAVRATAESFRLRLATSGSPGIPAFVRHHDQIEFDAIVDRMNRALDGHSFYRLGFYPGSIAEPDASIFTYVFAHEDWLHLLPNVLLILLAGLFLEEVWGHALFLLFLAFGAVSGAAGYAVLDPEADEVLGGASGVAAALCGAFLVRFAFARIRFQYFTIPPFGGKFTTRGWVLLPIYGALYFAADYVLTQGVPGIEPVRNEFATWAHVGGLAGGIVFAALLKVLRVEERWINPRLDRKLTAVANPGLDAALEAREAGRLEEAAEMLAHEVRRRRGDRDVALAYWDAAAAVGRPEQAVDVLVRVLRDEVAAHQDELAVQHWRELTQRLPDHALEPGIEIRIAAALLEQQEHDLARFCMERVLDRSGGAPAAAHAHKLARMAQDLDGALALRAARAALAAEDLEPGEREDVEGLIAQLAAVAEREAGATTESGLLGADPLDVGGDDLDAGGAESLDLDDHDLMDGDTLNAEPFELDDLSEPPGVQTYDLESAEEASPDGGGSPPAMEGAAPDATDPPGAPALDLASPLERGLPDATPPSPSDAAGEAALAGDRTTLLDDDTSPAEPVAAPGDSTPSLDPSARLDDSTPSLDPSARLDDSTPSLDPAAALGDSTPSLDRHAVLDEDAHPGAADAALADTAGAPAAPDAPAEALDDGLPPLDDELPDDLPPLEPDDHDLVGGATVPPHASLGDTAPSLQEIGLPEPPDDDIPLADASDLGRRRLHADDTGAPDFGSTIDLADLGAQTVPAWEAGPRARAVARPTRATRWSWPTWGATRSGRTNPPR